MLAKVIYYGDGNLIQAIWIITETGQCIFSHKYVKMDIEDQLISGLLTAFNAFSTESGIGGIQQIGGEDNQFVYGSAGKLLVAALADTRDDPTLVETLLNKISISFQEKYSIYLTDDMYVDLNIFNGFESDIDQILFPKISARGVGSTIFGTFVTMALTIGVLLIMVQIPNIFPNLNQGVVNNLVYLIFLGCVPGFFVGALTAGTRKFALIANTIGILPVIGYFAYDIAAASGILLSGNTADLATTIPIVMLMAEQYIAIALLTAILGGGIIERKRLFPFPKNIDRVDADRVQDMIETYEQPQIAAPQQDTAQTQDYYASSSFVDEQQQVPTTPTPPSQDYQQQD
ncbi:MAG: hypothetical protein ACTSPM_11335 [Candidatus Heimdallarchaeota archaeon]